MKRGKASRTAEGMAFFKTVESVKPENERIYHDPVAKHFLGNLFGVLVKSRLMTKLLLLYYEHIWPGGYGYIIARTRYVDDYLKTCLADGIDQLVIMGAGYDSRAYTFSELKNGVRVFEVDHPSTHKRKFEKLEKIFGSNPGNVRFIPFDLTMENFGKKLLAANYDNSLKTLFIMEGVSMYLTDESVDETLAFIVNNSGEGSSLIFNYMNKSFVDGADPKEDIQIMRKRLQRVGEPATFGVEDGTIIDFLEKRNFHQVVNVTGDDLKNIYFKNHHITVSNLVPIAYAKILWSGR